jgi:hypothetical protein
MLFKNAQIQHAAITRDSDKITRLANSIFFLLTAFSSWKLTTDTA